MCICPVQAAPKMDEPKASCASPPIWDCPFATSDIGSPSRRSKPENTTSRRRLGHRRVPPPGCRSPRPQPGHESLRAWTLERTSMAIFRESQPARCRPKRNDLPSLPRCSQRSSANFDLTLPAWYKAQSHKTSRGSRLMKICCHAANLWIVLVVLLGMVRFGLGHEPTAQRFERARALAVAKIRQAAEPAPQADSDKQSCRLTIELTIGDNPQPVAGLIRVTNLDSGKALSFAEEIHRDKNWYAIAPRTVLSLPRAKLKVEAFHGLETTLATREIDLTGCPTHSLSIPLKRF